MSDIYERIFYLVEKEADSNFRKFGKMIGFSDTAVSNVAKLKRNLPGFEMISSILRTFVDINPDWLLLGKGPIKREKTESTANQASELLLKRVEELAIENNELKKEVVRLKENQKNRVYPIASEPEP